MLRSLVLVLVCAVGFTACATTMGPEVRVLGVQESLRREVVFVQVTNPARRPMRLTRLAYVFASQGRNISTGELPLARDVPAGAAVIVEVPLDLIGGLEADGLTLSGQLEASVDEIVRTFAVSAEIRAPSASVDAAKSAN